MLGNEEDFGITSVEKIKDFVEGTKNEGKTSRTGKNTMASSEHRGQRSEIIVDKKV